MGVFSSKYFLSKTLAPFKEQNFFFYTKYRPSQKDARNTKYFDAPFVPILPICPQTFCNVYLPITIGCGINKKYRREKIVLNFQKLI